MDEQNYVFKKDYSLKLKGLLVIMMYWSHMFNHPDKLGGVAWTSAASIGGEKIEILLCPFFHIAVPAFFFISGYGFYCSHKNGIKVRKLMRSIEKVYRKYWIVFLVTVPLCFALGFLSFDFLELIENLFGVSSSYCGEWWFLSTYVEINIAFTLIYAIAKKMFGQIKRNEKNEAVSAIAIIGISLGIATAGYAMKIIVERFGCSVDLNSNDIFIKEIYYLLIKQPMFVSGYVVARFGIFERLLNWLQRRTVFKTIGYVFLGVFVLVVPYIYGEIPETYIYTLYTGVFIFVFCRIMNHLGTYIHRLFEFFGKYSTYMWLIHSMLLYRFATRLIYVPRISVACWLLLILLTAVSAIVLTQVERGVIYLYSKAFTVS